MTKPDNSPRNNPESMRKKLRSRTISNQNGTSSNNIENESSEVQPPNSVDVLPLNSETQEQNEVAVQNGGLSESSVLIVERHSSESNDVASSISTDELEAEPVINTNVADAIERRIENLNQRAYDTIVSPIDLCSSSACVYSDRQNNDENKKRKLETFEEMSDEDMQPRKQKKLNKKRTICTLL